MHVASFTHTLSGTYTVRLSVADDTGLLVSVYTSSEELSGQVVTERASGVSFYGTPSAAASAGTGYLLNLKPQTRNTKPKPRNPKPHTLTSHPQPPARFSAKWEGVLWPDYAQVQHPEPSTPNAKP